MNVEQFKQYTLKSNSLSDIRLFDSSLHIDLNKLDYKIAVDTNDVTKYIPVKDRLYSLPILFNEWIQDMLGSNWKSKIASLLADNVTLIQVNNKMCKITDTDYYLALTKTTPCQWELAETYINLDMLPPLDCCIHLYDDGSVSETTKYKVLAACIMSIRVAKDRINAISNHINELLFNK
jgi:hypothetical protein